MNQRQFHNTVSYKELRHLLTIWACKPSILKMLITPQLHKRQDVMRQKTCRPLSYKALQAGEKAKVVTATIISVMAFAVFHIAKHRETCGDMRPHAPTCGDVRKQGNVVILHTITYCGLITKNCWFTLYVVGIRKDKKDA